MPDSRQSPFHAMVRLLGLTIRRHLPVEVSFTLVVRNRGGLWAAVGDLPTHEAIEVLSLPPERRTYDDILSPKRGG